MAYTDRVGNELNDVKKLRWESKIFIHTFVGETCLLASCHLKNKEMGG